MDYENIDYYTVDKLSCRKNVFSNSVGFFI